MATSSSRTFADAVAEALRYGGPDALLDAERFLRLLTDTADLNSKEMRVMRTCCDQALLAPLATSQAMTTEGLKSAARRIQHRLVDEYLIDGMAAQSVAHGLAGGVAKWAGIPLDLSELAAKESAKPHSTAKAGAGTTPKAKTGTAAPAGKPAVAPAGKPAATASKPTAPASTAPKAAAASQQPAATRQAQGTAANNTATKPVAAQKASGGRLLALLAAGLMAFCAWRLFGWRIGLEESSYAMYTQKTTLANGYVSDKSTYYRDAYGNLERREYTFETEDGETFEGTDTYSGYDRFGYPTEHINTYTVTEAGGKVSSWTTTTEKIDYRCDPSGRPHSKVVQTTHEYESSGGWTKTETTKELTTYTYENDLPFGLARLWTAKEDAATTSVTTVEYDKYLNETSYARDEVLSDGEASHFEATSTYNYLSGDRLHSSAYRYSFKSGSYSHTYSSSTDYDSMNNAIKVSANDNGELTITKYENEYDKNGNLVKRTNLTDSSVVEYTYSWKPKDTIARRSGIG